MIPPGILFLRKGRHIFKRVGLSNVFSLEATFASVGKARRFCANQPHGAAVRYDWLVEKLGFDNIQLED